jgi:hypothetical protein
VLLAFGAMGGSLGVTTPADVLAHPSLTVIATSLQLVEA